MLTRWRTFFRRPDATYIVLAILLLALGATLRLYDLTDQPIDFHPTRQLRGAIVARGIYYQLLPGADETMRQQAAAFWASTGQYEPSILEGLMALAYLAIGREVFWVGRVFNTLFWLIGGLAVLALARRVVAAQPSEDMQDRTMVVAWLCALAALAYNMTLPFGVQASRSLQPDPGMAAWLALSAFALYRWSETHSWRWVVLGGVVSGLAVLTKAIAVYSAVGMIIALAFYSFRKSEASKSGAAARLLLNPQLWALAALTLAPTAIYYLSRQGRAAEYFTSWTMALSHLLLEPRFYLSWLNMIQKLLNPVALIIAFVGLLLARGRNRALLWGWWAGYVVYGLFLPYQMTTHNYYHLQLVPLTTLSMAPAFEVGWRFLSQRRIIWRWAAGGVVLAIVTWMSWQALVPLYRENYRHEPAYWQNIASYLPGDGKIVALTQDYGYRLMYYGWRKVTLWPNRGEIKLSDLRGSSKEFEQYFAKRIQDKSYFLITAFKQFEDQPELKQMLYDHYPILAQGQGYLIFDLTQRKP